MSGETSDWTECQLLVFKDLERMNDNQKVMQTNQVEQGKHIAVLKLQMKIMSSVGGAIIVGAIGYIVKAIT